jgi:hypothetical protein
MFCGSPKAAALLPEDRGVSQEGHGEPDRIDPERIAGIGLTAAEEFRRLRVAADCGARSAGVLLRAGSWETRFE